MGKDIIIDNTKREVKPRDCCSEPWEQETYGYSDTDPRINPLTHVRLGKGDILQKGDQYFYRQWYPITPKRIGAPAGSAFIYRRPALYLLLDFHEL